VCHTQSVCMYVCVCNIWHARISSLRVHVSIYVLSTSYVYCRSSKACDMHHAIHVHMRICYVTCVGGCVCSVCVCVVFMYVQLCMYIRMLFLYIYVYIYIYIYTHTNKHVMYFVFAYVYAYTQTHTCILKRWWLACYSHIHVFVHVYSHIHKHTYACWSICDLNSANLIHVCAFIRQSVSHNCFYYTSKPDCAIPDDRHKTQIFK
jgi:hypothetical protein